MQDLQLREDSSREKFSVVYVSSAHAALVVELSSVRIRGLYTFVRSGPEGPVTDTRERGLRVYADLNGVTSIHENGGPAIGESGASEFLLKPLLDYIDE